MTTETHDDMKWYPVPEEIADLFDDAAVSEECRDQCIGSFFKAKRAIYYGTLARKTRRKAWALVRELYPELNAESISYNFERRAVTLAKNVVAPSQD
jgi:hypothetical protein